MPARRQPSVARKKTSTKTAAAASPTFLPHWHVADRFSRTVAAEPKAVFAAIEQLDVGASRRNRVLFLLRDLPSRLLAAEDVGMTSLIHRRLPILGSVPERSVTIGFVGKLWSPRLRLQLLDGRRFTAFSTPGFCKVIWHFTLQPRARQRTLLTLDTKVEALGGPLTRLSLRLYWHALHPLSAWVRGGLLQDVADAATS